MAKMYNHICFLYVVCILITLNSVIVTRADDEDEAEYTASMNMMTSCPDFDNTNIDVSRMTYTVTEDEEESKVKIGGIMGINKKIDEQFQCQVTIVKEHEGDKEVVFSILIKLCESLKDDKAPHKPLMDAMGITKCPIDEKDYELSEDKEIILKMDDFKELMNKEYVGSYVLWVTCETTPPNKDSCHEVEMSISEVEKSK